MTDDLYEFERQLWERANDVDFYSERLVEEAVLVFPAPFGLLDREATLAAVSSSAGWREFELDDFRVVPLADGSAAAAYRASAVRPDGSSYAAYCSSVYLRGKPGWQLALHQQTPIGEAAE
ncbi:MAG TPA: DUF4440 domain-containing protein [Gaiellaceae bacterium]|nr:DUF4440 domain-containing protein [Gaiellaceae bacterium]